MPIYFDDYVDCTVAFCAEPVSSHLSWSLHLGLKRIKGMRLRLSLCSLGVGIASVLIRLFIGL